MLFAARAFLWKDQWLHGPEGIIPADFCRRHLVFIVIIDSPPIAVPNERHYPRQRPAVPFGEIRPLDHGTRVGSS